MHYLRAIVVALALSGILHFSTQLIADPDALYHLRHASLLRENSIFNTAFPWAQFSAIKTFGADMWYGFHLLLIPFTFIPNPLLALAIAGLAVTAAAFLIYYRAFYTMRLHHPLFWTTLLFISSSQFLLRTSMLRPHVLTSALSVLLLPALFYMNAWVVFGIAFLIPFLHSTVFWIPLMIVGAFTAAQLIKKEPVPWHKVITASIGVLIGLLCRPNAMGLLPLLRIVLIDIQSAKLHRIPLSIGSELKPMLWWIALQQYIPFILLGVGIGYLVYRHRISQQTQHTAKLTSSTALASIFFILVLFIARRFIDIGNAFFILAAGLTISSITYRSRLEKKIFPVMAIISIVFCTYTVLIIFWEPADMTDPTLTREPAEWLREHTPQGSIVFHAHWDDFPKLFFWNTHNYYINGMDPVLLYAYDPTLYFQQLYFAIDAATDYTCGATGCKQAEVIPTNTALLKNFRSSYIFLDQQKNPRLITHLAEAPNIQKVFTNERFTIFKIMSTQP
jgi:hypothetical protein